MGEILALGAIAGFTVFLGLPLGRMRSASTKMRSLLTAGATGILLFLFWDVLAKGVAPVEAALSEATKAQEQVATGHTRGKIVLRVGDDPK